MIGFWRRGLGHLLWVHLVQALILLLNKRRALMADVGTKRVGNDREDKVALLNPAQAKLLEDNPFVGFLGMKLVNSADDVSYQLSFRDQHMGNPLLRTFHGGILASLVRSALLCML